jgi:hypothetical protein
MFGGLSSFSELLTSTLNALDVDVHSMHTAHASTVKKVESTVSDVGAHEIRLRNLETETEQLRDKLERTVISSSLIEKQVNQQLSEHTKNIYREMLSQRTSNKIDIHALKSTLSQSINDTIDLISDTAPLSRTSTQTYSEKSSNEEKIKYLVEKVKMLEELITMQHTVNKKLSEHIQNNEAMDALYRHVEAQSGEIKAMQENQEAQRKQIEKLSEALLLSRRSKSRPSSSSVRPSSSNGRVGSRPTSSRLPASRPGSSSRLRPLSLSRDEFDVVPSGQDHSLDVLLNDAPDNKDDNVEVIDDPVVPGDLVKVTSRAGSANSIKKSVSNDNSSSDDRTQKVVHVDSGGGGASDMAASTGKRKQGRLRKHSTASNEHEHDGSGMLEDSVDPGDSSLALGSRSGEDYEEEEQEGEEEEGNSAADEFDEHAIDSHDESHGSGDFAAVSSDEFHEAIRDTKKMIVNLRREYSTKTGSLSSSSSSCIITIIIIIVIIIIINAIIIIIIIINAIIIIIITIIIIIIIIIDINHS